VENISPSSAIEIASLTPTSELMNKEVLLAERGAIFSHDGDIKDVHRCPSEDGVCGRENELLG
jgi:hypothetical protein